MNNFGRKKMNESPYIIFGKERRTLKKKSSELKYHLKDFWYKIQLDRDMGSGISDCESQEIYDRFVKRKRRIDFFLTIKKNK